MSFTAVWSGFFLFAVLLSVIQAQGVWRVTYTPIQICAFRGSTVDMSCTFSYPATTHGQETTAEKMFWFVNRQDGEAVDLRTVPEYSGRVQYQCDNNRCSLTIRDLRESDTAEYRFKFITNQEGGSYTGSPGVTLSVTGLRVTQDRVSSCPVSDCSWTRVTCYSSCLPPGHVSYIWYKNGQIIGKRTEVSFADYFYGGDSFACAVRGHEDSPSSSVCVHGTSCNKVNYLNRRVCAFTGSSVDISCWYDSKSNVQSKFWLRSAPNDQQPYHLRPVNLLENAVREGRAWDQDRSSTLRIVNLKKSDAAEYHFRFETQGFEWTSDLPGTTLTVTDPDLQVQVIRSPSGPQLVCHSSCLLPGRSSFVWYRNGKRVQSQTSASFRGDVQPEDSYSCGHQRHRSDPVCEFTPQTVVWWKYAPKAPSASTSSSGDVMKDGSVTLTCSSDANPAAQHTWYKNNQTLLRKEPRLVLSSIQASDSGEYFCSAENELGTRTSGVIIIDVKYGPQTSTVSVSPSGEIVEGSSVNLTCSSDANPAATYTWYKGNQTLLQGRNGAYHFTSISSEDRGLYHCTSENQYGQINSTSLSLDVDYAPRLPSVSVSPSGEIVEGSSVNLTCSSDANPAANYTWYKENEDSPKAAGQTFTIPEVSAEHGGNYFCEARNSRGRRRSTLRVVVAAAAWKAAAGGTIAVVLLAAALLALLLWLRRNESVPPRDERAGGPQVGQDEAERRDDLHYASVCFARDGEDALYSNVRTTHPRGGQVEEEEEEEEGVEYSDVRVSAPGAGRPGDGGDSFELYSTVNKKCKATT